MEVSAKALIETLQGLQDLAIMISDLETKDDNQHEAKMNMWHRSMQICRVLQENEMTISEIEADEGMTYDELVEEDKLIKSKR